MIGAEAIFVAATGCVVKTRVDRRPQSRRGSVEELDVGVVPARGGRHEREEGHRTVRVGIHNRVDGHEYKPIAHARRPVDLGVRAIERLAITGPQASARRIDEGEFGEPPPDEIGRKMQGWNNASYRR